MSPVILRVYNTNYSAILAETLVDYMAADDLINEIKPLVEKHQWHIRAIVPSVVDVFKLKIKIASEDK